jgi:hypothetical protein
MGDVKNIDVFDMDFDEDENEDGAEEEGLMSDEDFDEMIDGFGLCTITSFNGRIYPKNISNKFFKKE